ARINVNTFLVTNYPILDMAAGLPSGPRSRAVCFAGGISPQWNHISVLRAIEDIADVRYILAGSGPGDYLATLQRMSGWSKVDFRGRVSHEEVGRIYAKSAAGVTLLSFDTQVGNEGTLGNTKIFEFMEAGLPIICSSNRIWQEIVDRYKCGISVDPGDAVQIRDAISSLLNDPELAAGMGMNGRRAVQELYNWETQEKVLLSIYEGLKGFYLH
ncbi:MAG: glycosyltransferase, partial [Saccharofermentanales bacterium]